VESPEERKGGAQGASGADRIDTGCSRRLG
jgi:hypothetical protein